MGRNPLRNKRTDRGARRIQSGPDHSFDDLNLRQTYQVVGSGYTDSLGNYISWYGVNNQGADFGIRTDGPPQSGGIITTDWRAVPPAVSGFWTDYQEIYYTPSGALSIEQGYRISSRLSVANANVQSAYSPDFGVREGRTFTYFGGVAPDTQDYAPYNTPASNTPTQGYTGGGVTHARYEGTLLTNPTNDNSGSRTAWVYNPPVYCQTFTETIRSTVPGAGDVPLRRIYRGKSTRYSYNLGGIYGVLGEGIRNMTHTFSSSVNSSNQKSI